MNEQLNVASITVDECGRPILSDDELMRLERLGQGTVAGRGYNYQCPYTSNGGCVNAIDCRYSTNGVCGNMGLCPKFQEQ
jgi:hypothetical protein